MLKPIIEFDYFGLNIYLLMACVGILFSILILLKRMKELKISEKEELTIILILSSSALIGLLMANMTNWLFMPELLKLPILERFEQAGFNFYGGILSFLLCTYLLIKLFKMNSKQWMNLIVPSILIFHAFGRIGCSLAGCCYGIEWHSYPLIAHTHFELFPAREIESLVLIIMTFIFLKREISKPLLVYLLFYASIRFLLEFLRGDYRGHLFVSFFSPAQVISLLLVIMVLFYWFFGKVFKRKINHY